MKIAFTFVTPNSRDKSVLAVRSPVEEGLRLIGAAGFDGVELLIRDPGGLTARQVGKVAEANELTVPAIGTRQMCMEDGLSLCHLDPGVRSRTVQETRLAVDIAAALGSQLNIGCLRGNLPLERPEAAIEAARESFRSVIEYAGSCGVPIAIEPLNHTVCNWINTVEEAIEWIGQFNPRPTILFDVFHASLEETSVHAALIRAWPHLSWVHLSDSNRRAPGLGHYPFPETIRILDALGYDGYLSIECRQEPDSAAVARQTAAYLAPLLAETGS